MFGVFNRSGERGRGKQIVIVATEAEGKTVADYLKGDGGMTGDVIVSEIPTVVVETPEVFIARHTAEKKKAARITNLRASLVAAVMAKREAGDENTLNDDELKDLLAEIK